MIARAAFVLAALAALARPAGAEGELEALSPRAVGHAAHALVSDDGPAALLSCPAAIARRDDRRVTLAGLAVDDDVWRRGEADHPRVSDRGPAELSPLAGAIGAWGPLILGAAVATTESIDRRLPAPEAALPPATVSSDFPHRYGGLELRHRRDTLALGAALRPNDWLALGVSVTASRVESREARRIWAGFGGRDALGDPARDLTVTVDGHDGFVPGFAAGALVAPADVPLELALGVSWAGDVAARGDVTVTAAQNPPVVESAGPAAARTTASPLVLHAGVRWVGARYAAEAGATAWTYPGDGDGTWAIEGIDIVDDSGATAPLTRLAGRAGRRSHGALGASTDVEVLPGFLWLAAGYAWRGAGQSRFATTTTGLDPGGHTFALGVDLTAGAATITAGWSRQLVAEVTVGAAALPYDNPFAGGSAAANRGTHGVARDQIGLGLELVIP